MALPNLAKWLRWSNTRQAWYERLGLCGILAAALTLWFLADSAPVWLQVFGWGALALLLAFFSRRGWLKLFGPVLFYDLVRNARRTRFFAYRITYLGVLLFLLCWMYLNWRPNHYRLMTEPIRSSEAAELSLLFFITFLSVQMLFVVVLTPAFTAGAITEEKERKTIEFILATDLRNREIVFGKLLSRMAALSMFILAGLPVLSALQFLGGFSPRALLVSFAGTMLTMVSLVALSLLASALARRTREALLLVYLILVGYIGVTVLAHLQLHMRSGNSFPSTETWESPLTVADVLLGIRDGNPVFAVSSVLSPRGIDEDGLTRALGTYAIFHGLLAFVCTAAAVGLIRWASLKEQGTPRAASSKRWFWRPAPGHWPMIWKEVWSRRSGKRRWLLGGGMLLLVVLSFVPAVVMLSDYFRMLSMVRRPSSYTHRGWSYDQYSDYLWEHLGREINEWVRIVGTLAAVLGWAGVGVRAATSVRGEHDRDTMTSLLTTPLTSEEILFGKWLGSLTSMRWFVVWLLLIWAVGVAYNGLSPLTVPLLAVACLFYAGAAASIGLWCSVVFRTSLRAILGTLLAGLLLFGAHWIPWMCCLPFNHRAERDLEVVVQMQGAMTPPVVVAGYLPTSPHDLEHERSNVLWNPYWLLFVGMSGAGMWGLLAWFVGLIANQRFKQIGGRLDSIQRRTYPPDKMRKYRAPENTDSLG